VKISACLKSWLKDESGATAIEYGLIAATMALMLIPTIGAFTDGSESLFGSIVKIFDHPMFDDGYFG
jgi:Flp pilus assembly pilin Flp